MKITRKENYIIIKDDKETVTDFTSKLTKGHEQFEKENVVIDILKFHELELEELLGFLELSDRHRAKSRSFVIVNDAIPIDKIPEELVVVPSLQEAEDMIQMDEIQRDLGF